MVVNGENKNIFLWKNKKKITTQIGEFNGVGVVIEYHIHFLTNLLK